MSTIREQIVAAATTALNTDPPAEVPEFVRTRLDSPGPDQLPVNTIYQASETVTPVHDSKEGRSSRGPIVRRTLVLKIECLTKADGAAEPDKAADPTIAWVTKTLAAAGRFNDLANNPADETGTQFEYEQGETSFCRATMTFHIEFQSKTDDAEQLT
jgi:hypothetical protein